MKTFPNTADEYRDQIVSRADHFTASRFRGRGKYQTIEAPTLDGAIEAAESMNAPAMIYAVTAEGRSVHVQNVNPKRTKTMNTETTYTICTDDATIGEAITDETVALTTAQAAHADTGVPVHIKDAKGEIMHTVGKPAAAKTAAKAKPAAPKTAAKAKPAAPKRKTAPKTAAKRKTAPKTAAKRKTAPKTAAKRKTAPKAKPAAAKPAAKPAPAPVRTRVSYKEQLAAAETGTLPPAPDFSAKTHERYRAKLAELVAMAEAGNVKGLKAYTIKPYSSSPKAMDRYRNNCVTALEAQKKAS